MLIIFLACYNCFVLPVEIAFNQNKTLTGFNQLRYANHIIDCFFFIDIIIGFRVTYRDAHTNEEIMNPKKIAFRYLTGEFWLDLISTIPFDLIVEAVAQGSGDNFVALSMVKLSRVLRIQKLIMYLNSTDEVKNTLNLLKTVLIIVLYLHLGACFWFFIVNRERLWYPGNWLCPRCAGRDFFKSTGYADISSYILDQYLLALYAAIMQLNGNDILPTTGIEMSWSILGLLMGSFMNAYIFGNLVVLVQSMNRKMQLFQEKLDITNTTMKNMKLSTEIQLEVRQFLMKTQSGLDHQTELTEFLAFISPSLRLQVI